MPVHVHFTYVLVKIKLTDNWLHFHTNSQEKAFIFHCEKLKYLPNFIWIYKSVFCCGEIPASKVLSFADVTWYQFRRFVTYDFRFQLTSEWNFHYWRFNVKLFFCSTNQPGVYLYWIEKLERNKEVLFPFHQNTKTRKNRTK